MLRWILLIVAIVGLSAAIPLFLAYMPIESTGKTLPVPVEEVPKGDPGKVFVEEARTYNIGNLSTFSEGSREFVVKNVGKGPLKLMAGATTCFCTVANFENKEKSITLEPGESTPIKVTWNTKEKTGKFDQRVTIQTSDPAQPELDFRISGMIYPPIVLVPEHGILDFASVPNDQVAPGRLALTSFDRPETQITEVVSARPGAVTAEIVPLTDEEKTQLKFESGYSINLSLQPAPVLGAFTEEATIKTDHPKMPEVKILLQGKRIGAVSVSPDSIRLDVNSSKGGQMGLVLLVREQAETQFEVVEKPEELDVSIEPASSANESSKVKQYRVTVSVPAGTPPGVTKGRLVIKTDHPKVGSIVIPVSMVVLGGS